MSGIDLKYMIPLTGEYNAGISDCPNCGFEPECIQPHIIGFSNSNIGRMVVCECPKCFTKWYFHARTNIHYNYFLQWIEMGLQLHYSSTQKH
jgi:hypothetical protein